jgi:hypothetical protein
MKKVTLRDTLACVFESAYKCVVYKGAEWFKFCRTIEVMEIATKVMLNQKQKWHMGPQVPYASFAFFFLGSRAAKSFPPLFCCPLS